MDEESLTVVDNKTFLSTNALHGKLALRSELAQEMISRKAGFLETWALLIFLGILLLLLAGTWFIKYPDIIEARATLTAVNAPKEIIPLQTGRLVRLFAANNTTVSKNEILGWIESTASHEEVITLSEQIDSSLSLLSTRRALKIAGLFDRRYNKLGEIQQGYQQFITALQLFKDYETKGFYAKKKILLLSDRSTLDYTRETMQRQKEMTEQDLKLAQETYEMNKKLADEKVISREEFRIQKSKYLNKKEMIPQLNANLLANEAQRRDKQKELDQLDHDMSQQQTIFQQALQSLKSLIDDWKRKYLLQSPIDGKVSYIIPLQENQFLQQGKLLGYINPKGSHFYSEAYLAQNNFGKIDTGLKVQLRFDAYPYQELGFVEGTLNYVSNVASDSGFLATIRLDKGLVTNNNRPIAYRNGLKGQAIIITKNMRLLQRLWYNINKSTSVGSR